MRRKTTKTKKNLVTFGAAVVILVTGFFCFFHFSSADGFNFNGFGWIGNNLVNGVNTGEPAIGWLSFFSGQTSCTGSAYAVTLGGNKEDDTRPVNGYAWFGIGSAQDPYSASLSGLTCQNDGESIGWVDFQAGKPPVDVCNANPSNRCDSVYWHRTGDDYQGDIDGWAKIVSMGDDGWISLKGSKYSFKLDKDGLAKSDSYGWNSGKQGTNVGDNSGLGWIGFANAEICNIAFPSASQMISETASSLSLIRNRAGNVPVSVDLTSSNSSRLDFPTNPVTFPAKKASYDFPVSIAKLPNDWCTDPEVVTVTAQSICGESKVDLSVLKSCSTKCSPKKVSILPGETAIFTSDVQGFSDPSVTWSISGDESCVESAKPDGSTYTVVIKKTTSEGKFCTMKSFQVKATSTCGSCGSDTCELLVTRPGWIETNP